MIIFKAICLLYFIFISIVIGRRDVSNLPRIFAFIHLKLVLNGLIGRKHYTNECT